MVKRVLWLAAAAMLGVGASAAEKRIVLIAGKASHGPGDHEFRAGCLLLQKCLGGVPGIRVEVYDQGWPKESSVLEGASEVVVYADGGPGHPCFQDGHRQVIQELAHQGAGLGFMHYGVEVPKGEPGETMWEWVGGYYEDRYSCNPMWSPDYQQFPKHPISQGVRPFSVVDEWYINMRFSPESARRTSILVAKPSDAVRDGPYVWPAGPYAHIQANKGREETMMWAYERPDGGRGFGWTGGHHHRNWANDNYRKVVLNAILWAAKVEVPPDGVASTVSPEDMARNLDKK